MGLPGEKKKSWFYFEDFFDERRECVDVDGPVATPGVGFTLLLQNRGGRLLSDKCLLPLHHSWDLDACIDI